MKLQCIFQVTSRLILMINLNTKIMNESREEISKKYLQAQKVANELRKQLDEIDSQDRYDTIKTFVGKAYAYIEQYKEGKYVDCFYVSGISKDYQLESLRVTYWSETYDSFSIESYRYFKPWNKDKEEYVEITKEQFIEHFERVQNKVTTRICREPLLLTDKI